MRVSRRHQTVKFGTEWVVNADCTCVLNMRLAGKTVWSLANTCYTHDNTPSLWHSAIQMVCYVHRQSTCYWPTGVLFSLWTEKFKWTWSTL